MRRSSYAAAGAIFVASMLGAMAGVAPARGESQPPLIVRLYNTARLPAPDLLTARDEASGILRATGLDMIFRPCGSAAAAGEAADPCAETLKSSEIVVRIIDAPAFNATLDPDAYGVAYIVSSDVNRGWLATVFADRIGVAAARIGVEPGVLAGRVMAHEIGHLLLGNDHHGNVGVMQAEWTDAMLTRPDDTWRFTMVEAARIRQNRSLLR